MKLLNIKSHQKGSSNIVSDSGMQHCTSIYKIGEYNILDNLHFLITNIYYQKSRF